VRRRVADKERWSLQLVLRLARPIELEPAPIADLAAVHFGWLKGSEGRRYVQLPTHFAYLDALGGSRIAGIAASETNLT
jgi:hypothetical protein